MAKKTRIRTGAIDAPKSLEEAAECMGRIGAAQRERDRIQADLSDEHAKVKERYEAAALPHRLIIEANLQALQVFAEANKDMLLKGKTKTVKLATGEFSWRKRPASVTIRGAEAVLTALKSLKLTKFIRSKEEVNKDAILLDKSVAEKVKGITINEDLEDFVVKPLETHLEEVR